MDTITEIHNETVTDKQSLKMMNCQSVMMRIVEQRIDQVIEGIQKNLTPDLLKEKFRSGNVNNPFFGHCYHATEALYYLIRELELPESFRDFKPCRGTDANNVPHWWLQDKEGA